MAYYVFHRIAARGPLPDLLALQAMGFDHAGDGGWAHGSSWERDADGLFLAYAGSDAMGDPRVDACARLSGACGGALIELSFIDEAATGDGCLVFRGGQALLSSACPAEAMALLQDRMASDKGFDGFGALEAEHGRIFAEFRKALGWASPAPDSALLLHLDALGADSPRARELGALAGIDEDRMLVHALLMDAPSSLPDSIGGACLAASFHRKATPWGEAAGMRCLAALAGRGELAADDPRWIRAIPSALDALLLAWSGADGGARQAEMLGRLFANEGARGLLLRGSASGPEIEAFMEKGGGGAATLGERCLFSPRRWPDGPRDALAASLVSMSMGAGRSDWIDQAFARVAQARQACASELGRLLAEAERGSGGGPFDRIFGLASSALRAPTLELLLGSTALGIRQRALAESLILGMGLGSSASGARFSL